MVSAYLYTLLGLSDYAQCDLQTRENLGWALLGIIFASLTVNVGKTIFLIVTEIVRLINNRK